MSRPAFAWPDGARAAVTLSFDDARASQLDFGMTILREHKVRSSFYVSLDAVTERIDQWRAVPADGHEIGNHSTTHPCSGNHPWVKVNALEDLSLEQIEADILSASDAIMREIGIRAVTFAYPCGEHVVGRGEQAASYVPIVARHFEVGRGFSLHGINDPLRCDLAHTWSMSFDRMKLDDVVAAVDQAIDLGGWLILTGHEILPTSHRQGVGTDMLDALCRHLTRPGSGVWVDTVAAVGRHILRSR